MGICKLLLCNILLFTLCLALPTSVKQETKPNTTASTHIKDTEAIKEKNQLVQPSKPETQKRAAAESPPAGLFEESEDGDGMPVIDYPKAMAYTFTKPFNNFYPENRRKRTAILQQLLAPPGTRPKRELDLTPDDVLALLALWEEQRKYNNLPSVSRWSTGDDNNLELFDKGGRLFDEDVLDPTGDYNEDEAEKYQLLEEDTPRFFKSGLLRQAGPARMVDFRPPLRLNQHQFHVPLYRRAVL